MIVPEEDRLAQPPAPPKQPVLVLCGPAAAGRAALARQLLSTFPDKFAAPGLTTDRKPGKGEVREGGGCCGLLRGPFTQRPGPLLSHMLTRHTLQLPDPTSLSNPSQPPRPPCLALPHPHLTPGVQPRAYLRGVQGPGQNGGRGAGGGWGWGWQSVYAAGSCRSL